METCGDPRRKRANREAILRRLEAVSKRRGLVDEDEAQRLFCSAVQDMRTSLSAPKLVRGAWIASYRDWGHKNRRLASTPFTMWAALRGREVRFGFETRKDAIVFATS